MHTLGNSFLSVVRRFLRTMDTPRSLTVALLIEHEEWAQVVSLTCSPGDYNDPLLYFKDEACTSLLRKCAGLPTGINTEAVALKSFSAAEKQCCSTNTRLWPYLHSCSLEYGDGRLSEIFSDIRKDITFLLGRIPRDLFVKHGPGATFSDRGSAVSAIHKMSSQPSMTSLATCLLPLWEETSWSRGLVESHPYRSRPRVVRGNRFTTVPKDATKDRGIAIEPSINVAYQLCVGKHIRERLHKWHIDLRSGQDRHRLLARDASRNGHLCTIDLSNASDTVSRNLVKLLLPEEWWDLVSTLRSPCTLIKGKWHFLEKFSSMGNGFTFELETLLFASLVRVCARNKGIILTPLDFGVYGDDIICPSSIASDVLAVLRFCGFTPNPRKTFTSGWFRESCGGDFFNGFSVRAHFIENEPRSPAAWISLHNGFYRLQSQFNDFDCGVDLSAVMRACIDQIPAQLRTFFGPPGLGDLVLNTDEESKWNSVVEFSIRSFRVWRPVAKLFSYRIFSPGPMLAGALYGVASEGFSLRDCISGYRVGWAPFS